MQVVALSKAVRQSPRKIGLVASLVRGRSVADALVILEHTPKRAAEPIRKTIESARANAENNHDMKVETLVIDRLDIGPAPSMKRYRPIAHGSAHPFKLRSTNIRVVLEGEQRIKKKSSPKKADKKKTDAKKVVSKEDSTSEKPTADKIAKEDSNKKRIFTKKANKQSNTPITKQRTGVRGNK